MFAITTTRDRLPCPVSQFLYIKKREQTKKKEDRVEMSEFPHMRRRRDGAPDLVLYNDLTSLPTTSLP